MQQAAATGQKEILQLLIANKTKFADYGFQISKAFVSSISIGNTEIIDLLLAEKPNINQSCDYCESKTPLMIAINYGNKGLTEQLLKMGADINAKDPYLQTPLHFAASAGDTATINYLVQKGVNINSANEGGGTPLIYAALYNQIYKNQRNTFFQLIRLGANPKVKLDTDKNLLMCAIEGGNAEIIDYALNITNDINEKTKEPHPVLKDVKQDGFNALGFAIFFNDAASAKKLIDKKIDLNYKNKAEYTALDLAIVKDRKEIVRLLLASGATVSELNYQMAKEKVADKALAEEIKKQYKEQGKKKK